MDIVFLSATFSRMLPQPNIIISNVFCTFVFFSRGGGLTFWSWNLSSLCQDRFFLIIYLRQIIFWNVNLKIMPRRVQNEKNIYGKKQSKYIIYQVIQTKYQYYVFLIEKNIHIVFCFFFCVFCVLTIRCGKISTHI